MTMPKGAVTEEKWENGVLKESKKRVGNES